MQTTAQVDVNRATQAQEELVRSESELAMTVSTASALPMDCDLNQTFITGKAKDEGEISDSFGDLFLPMNPVRLTSSVSMAFERQPSEEYKDESPPKKQKTSHAQVVFVHADKSYQMGFNPWSNMFLVADLLSFFQAADSVTVSAAMDTFVNKLLVTLLAFTTNKPEIDRVSSPFNDSQPIKSLDTAKRNVKSTPAVRNAFVDQVLTPLAERGLVQKLEYLSLNYPYEGKYFDYFKDNQEEIQRSLLPDNEELFNFLTLAHAEFGAIVAEFTTEFKANQAPASAMTQIVQRCKAARARIAFALNPLAPPECVEDFINRICNLDSALLKRVSEKVANTCKAGCKWLQKRDEFPPMLFDAIVTFTFGYLKWLLFKGLITQGEFQTFIKHTETGMSEQVFMSLLDNQLTHERLLEFAQSPAPFTIEDMEVDDFFSAQIRKPQVQVSLVNQIFDTPELRQALLSSAQEVNHLRMFVFTTTLNAENQIATFPRGESQNPVYAHRAKILRDEIKKRDLLQGNQYQVMVEEAHAAAALRF